MLGLLAGALGGCVSQQEYDALYDNNRTLEERNVELVAQLEESNAAISRLQGSQGDCSTLLSKRDADITLLKQQIAQFREANADLESRLGSMDLGHLDPATDKALARLAAKFPKQIQYDPNRGMLRFASDMTFSSGSDQIRDEAKQTIAALADVLKMTEAEPYDVVIVGHTDSQPISSGTASRHPTNMHLSAHRAISVRDELKNLGIDPVKMQVAGWGEFRPAVPNAADGNTPQNRRVEVFLVASTRNFTGGPTSTTANVDTEAAPARDFDPTK
ncbi:MAG: OmpA family protein [Phycisphaerales bacterium]